MTGNCRLPLLIIAFAALATAHNLMIESHEVPSEVGTYGRFRQNRTIFMWQPFDSTRTHWDLTTYQGGQWARVGLLDYTDGLEPAPESMEVDDPPPDLVELDTLGSGSVQWIYEYQDSFGLYTDGIDFEQGGFRFLGNYYPDAGTYVTPMYYGAGWISAITWAYEIYPGIPYQATEQHTKRIVARGKVKVPMSGDYYWPCLVIRDNMVYSDNMGTEDRRWIYEWVVPGHFTGANGVAAAMSQNGASHDFINVETMMQIASCSIPDWDLNPPQFADTRVWPDTNYAGPFEVWSKITDDDVVGDESLFYRVNQGAWVSVEPDSEDGDTFFFTIPQVPAQARVDYYIWAMDDYCEANDIECWTTWPVCSPESTMVTFNVNAVGLAGVNPTPVEACLSALPNPFQDNVTFYYAVPSARRATVKVFSSSGELMRTIDMTRVPSVGFHASWDGRNEEGELVPAGTYLYRVETPTSIETRKVLLTR